MDQLKEKKGYVLCTSEKKTDAKYFTVKRVNNNDKDITSSFSIACAP